MPKVGVFGGSFDPPHLGHRALVESALRDFSLDEIWVIPVGIPVHRALTSYISAKQRFSWVKRMFADLPQVRVLDWEIEKKQCPAIETMREVSNKLGTTAYWLLGMDAWKGLPNWVAYPEHRNLCNMLIFSRRGEASLRHDHWLKLSCISPESYHQVGCVYYAEVDLPDISATRVRQDILTGKDVSTMLDTRIADEIRAAYKVSSHHGENT